MSDGGEPCVRQVRDEWTFFRFFVHKSVADLQSKQGGLYQYRLSGIMSCLARCLDLYERWTSMSKEAASSCLRQVWAGSTGVPLVQLHITGQLGMQGGQFVHTFISQHVVGDFKSVLQQSLVFIFASQ